MVMPDMTPDRMTEFVERLTQAQSALYGAIYTLLAGNAEVADVLQETNRVLWRKASTYDPTRPFLPWALTVARFEVLAHWKRQSRDRLVFDDVLLAQIAGEYERQSAHDGALQALERCLQKLPAAQRELVDERYLRGESVNDIAARQGRAANAVSALLYRIRSLLADCVDRTLTQEGIG
jgi:RNA polymerase sigma-70 factor (ECF subfamily)